MPQLTIYPELIGVWESERNASSPNGQSMALIFQLDPDPVQESVKEAGPLGGDRDPY